MKNLILFSALLTLVVGCDAPQRTRAPGSFQSNYGVPGSTGGFSTGGTSGGSTTGSSTGGTAGGTNGGSGTGFETCNLSDRYSSMDLGAFGLCQSTIDETAIKIRMTTGSTSYKTCLIPTYKDAQGSSTYIGQPQCTFTQPNQVILGKLYKNRSGFESSPLNAVMVMRETIMSAYFQCMDAYMSWRHPNCPNGAQTNPSCAQAARDYMTQTCNAFKNQYQNAYVDIRLQ